MLFQDLPLHPHLLSAIQQQGYTTPTPIQERAIPEAQAGRDLLACAQTGTGKTAAFALPILNKLLTGVRPGSAPRALVLVPTRELATQVAESFNNYSRGTGLRSTVVVGGVSQSTQSRALRTGVDIVVATPGRLLDLIGQRLVVLNRVEVVVLDEADRMLDMGFIRPIRQIIQTVPKVHQTLMFSATMPDSIRQLASQLLQNPVHVAVDPVASTVGKIDQQVYFVATAAKMALLVQVLNAPTAERVLVFTRTKHGADKVATRLRHARIVAEVIHGNKSQNARQRALTSFKNGGSRVLVATDVAARGIDVDGISHVVNYDVPHEPESYVHRIGRTGRAGACGTALSFCGEDERADLRGIERLIRMKLPVATTPTLTATATPPPQVTGRTEVRTQGVRDERRPSRFFAPSRSHRTSRAGGSDARSRPASQARY